MSLSPQIRKYLVPILRDLGFDKYRGWWRLHNDDNWLTQIEMKSSQIGDQGLYHLEVNIGFFSRDIDNLLGWGRKAGFTEHSTVTMPAGMLYCHFEGSLFDFDQIRQLGRCSG